MAGFLGTYRHNVDASRIAVPSKFKNEIGKKVYLTKDTDDSLILRTESEWEQFTEKLYEKFCSVEDEDVFDFVFSNTVDIDIDSHNRILIPADFLEYAGITDCAVIKGLGKKIKILSLESFEKLYKNSNGDDIRKKLMLKGM